MQELLISSLISHVVLLLLSTNSSSMQTKFAEKDFSTTAYVSTINFLEGTKTDSYSVTHGRTDAHHVVSSSPEHTKRIRSSTSIPFNRKTSASILLASEVANELAEKQMSNADSTQASEAASPASTDTKSTDSAKSSDKSKEVPPPFRVSGKISRNIQKFSGLNWITENGLNIGSSITAKLLLHGRPKVRFKIYALSDCFSGKFKSVSVDLKECSFHKVALTDLNFETTTPLQLRLFKTGKGAAGVGAPVMVAVTGEVDEKDVSKALQSPDVSSQLNFLRLQLPGLGDQHLQVLEPKVKIENGKVKINTWLITANAPKDTGVFLDITARPYLDGERFIFLKDTQVDSKDIMNPAEFSKFSEDLLNPLLDFGHFDRKTHAFRLTKLQVGEQNVQFAGKLLLVPKPVPAEKNSATNANK